MARRTTPPFGGPRPTTPTQQIPGPVGTGSSSPTTRSPKSPKSPKSPASGYSKSPRSSAQIAWTEERQRRAFIDSLSSWAMDHDSSPYFNGKISVAAPQKIQIGKDVRCILTNGSSGARKAIVIRLFAPHGNNERSKLVVRCGAGYMSAREYLSKDYFTRQQAARAVKKFPNKRLYHSHRHATPLRSGIPEPSDKDTVVIQPLFHPFLKLPLELQQKILGTAAGLDGKFQPWGYIKHSLFKPRPYSSRDARQPGSAISLATMFKISKSLNDHLETWIYRTTDFYFQLTGLTNFLWTCGPTNRADIRRITFDFDVHALLHCIRWLAPDPIFQLFEPPLLTEPLALRFLWRIQIKDLTRELRLSHLTLDITCILPNDVPFVVRILRHAFGSIQFLRLLYDGQIIDMKPLQLKELKERSWRQMCRAWYERHRASRSWTMAYERKIAGVDALEADMDKDAAFFDSVG
ncbi:hypothetical protein P280DRAFT_467281 [Massarina eburnea CBS 473.64]|uniref:Uncharacterized protein n=1 Tax=Massarina eburnea CBS 473.64 TaxID=1395130 RepID=A0A6A6S6F6_9PLEO|nr:hypothetical protein P280DRAFT_467281 [Massarina eburnea CBS 473.64]